MFDGHIECILIRNLVHSLSSTLADECSFVGIIISIICILLPVIRWIISFFLSYKHRNTLLQSRCYKVLLIEAVRWQTILIGEFIYYKRSVNITWTVTHQMGIQCCNTCDNCLLSAFFEMNSLKSQPQYWHHESEPRVNRKCEGY